MNEAKKLDLITGEIVMLSSTETDRDVMKEICKKHGLEKFSWQVMTQANALRLALKENYRGHMVRKSKEGYVVVKESVNDDGNDYETERHYRINADYAVEGNEESKAVHKLVQDRVTMLRGRMMAGVVTGHVSRLLVKHFGAIRMRPNGGCFFVPKESLERWNSWASDYVVCTGNTVHRVQSGCDANTASAVMKTASEDLEQRYKETLEELSNASENSSGRRLVKKRKRLMQELEDIKDTAKQVADSFGTSSAIASKIEKRIKVEKAIALM